MAAVLITGASSGIGYQLAKVYGRKGHNLILTARRGERLEELKQEILRESPYKPEIAIIEMDMGQKASPLELYNTVKNRGIEVETLINNAGFGIYGKFSELSMEDMERWDEMTDLNIRTLVMLTKLYLEEFLVRGKGEILNVSSIAGFLPGPLMSGYYGTKAYVLSFTEAVKEEVYGTGVKIGVLCPGPTITEFERSSRIDKRGLFSKMKAMDAERVAEIAYRDFQRGKGIIIPGVLNKIAVFGIRFLSRKMLVKISKKIQEGK